MNLECKRCGKGFALDDVEVVHRDQVACCRKCAHMILVNTLKRRDLYVACLGEERPGVVMDARLYEAATPPDAPS